MSETLLKHSLYKTASQTCPPERQPDPPACTLKAVSARSGLQPQPHQTALGFDPSGGCCRPATAGQGLQREAGARTDRAAGRERDGAGLAIHAGLTERQGPHGGETASICCLHCPRPLACTHTPTEAPLLSGLLLGLPVPPGGWRGCCHNHRNSWTHTHSICVAVLITGTGISLDQASCTVRSAGFTTEIKESLVLFAP